MMALCEGDRRVNQVWQSNRLTVRNSRRRRRRISGGSGLPRSDSRCSTARRTRLPGLSRRELFEPKLAYPGTAYVCAANFARRFGRHRHAEPRGSGSALRHGREWTRRRSGASDRRFSAQSAICVGFPGAISTRRRSMVRAARRCKLLPRDGACFSPTLNQTETASSVLTRWLQLLNVAAVCRATGCASFPMATRASPAMARPSFPT